MVLSKGPVPLEVKGNKHGAFTTVKQKYRYEQQCEPRSLKQRVRQAKMIARHK